jgi:hypothetical protein
LGIGYFAMTIEICYWLLVVLQFAMKRERQNEGELDIGGGMAYYFFALSFML